MNGRAWGRLSITIPSLVLAFALGGCAEDDPTPTDIGASDLQKGDGGGDGDAGDAAAPCTVDWTPPGGPDAVACTANPDDYVPGSPADPYAACVSDDNTYHRFDPSIGSIGRVAGFEKIAALLWRADGKAPDKQAFLDARVAFTEAEGLESRLARREDEHYPAAAKACGDMNATELAANAKRCVGPATLLPLLNDAFAKGSQGIEPYENAARIEGALLWFLYVSIYKESTTCTGKAKDCDSSYAYYTGGEDRSGGLGLARYVKAANARAHDRIWDGILAVRCWRDLDSGTPATNLTLRDKALAQLDRGLGIGLAQIIKSRLKAIEIATCDGAKKALWISTQLLGQALEREAMARDGAEAKKLSEALGGTGTAADLAAARAALAKLFPCV